MNRTIRPSDIITILCLLVILTMGYRMGGLEDRLTIISERRDTVYVAVPDSLTFRLMDLGFTCQLEEGDG